MTIKLFRYLKMNSTITSIVILTISLFVFIFSTKKYNSHTLEEPTYINPLNLYPPIDSTTQIDTFYKSRYDFELDSFINEKPIMALFHFPIDSIFIYENIENHINWRGVKFYYNKNGLSESQYWNKEHVNKKIKFNYYSDGNIKSIYTTIFTKLRDNQIDSICQAEFYQYRNGNLSEQVYGRYTCTHQNKENNWDKLQFKYNYDEHNRLKKTTVSSGWNCEDCRDTVNFKYLDPTKIIPFNASKSVYEGIEYSVSNLENDKMFFHKLYREGPSFFIETNITTKLDEKNRLVYHERKDTSTSNSFNIKHEKWTIEYSEKDSLMPMLEILEINKGSFFRIASSILDTRSYFLTNVTLFKYPDFIISTPYKLHSKPKSMINYYRNDEKEWKPKFKISPRKNGE